MERLEKIFKSSPSIIALIYIAVGMAWILYSDQMVLSIFENSETLTRVQSYKGFFFFIASGVLIYFLVKKSNDILENLFDQLTLTKDKLVTTFKYTPIGIAHLDSATGQTHVNRELSSITGYNEQEIGEMDFIDVLNPENSEKIERLDHELLRHDIGQYKVTELFKRKDGSRYTGDLTKSAVTDKQGRLLYIIAVLEDVTDAQKNREDLKKSLAQKETLLSEVHHRVRNNLALMSAMLELELMHTYHQNLAHTLIHYKTRLKSISLVYDFYSEENGELIVRLGDCLNTLVKFMDEVFENDGGRIQYRSELDTVNLNINQSIPAMLIYNELLMHINRETLADQDREVSIQLTDRGKKVQFAVYFSGHLSESSDLLQEDSLNRKLLDSFVDQLEGDMDTRSENGTSKITVEFEKTSALGSANHMEELETES